MAKEEKEPLYRKLAQTRRWISGPIDQVTRERLQAYAAGLEEQLAAIEKLDIDAPPE